MKEIKRIYHFERTTKERELNIPRRLSELFNRTFGPDDAPDSKAFDRICKFAEVCHQFMFEFVKLLTTTFAKLDAVRNFILFYVLHMCLREEICEADFFIMIILLNPFKCTQIIINSILGMYSVSCTEGNVPCFS